jgi:hypothetical protein
MGAVFSIFAACLQRATVPRPGARMSDALRPEEVLTRVPVFAALGRVELAKLAAYLETMAIEPGHEVFRQGGPRRQPLRRRRRRARGIRGRA